jgi:hypothetical protein
MVLQNSSTFRSACATDTWSYLDEYANLVVLPETPVIHFVYYLGILILKVVPCPGLLLI